MFDEYDFDYTDSKDSLLVQLADLISGSINKVYIDPQSPNYLEMLKGKIILVDQFPDKVTPYFASVNEETLKYDRDIFALCVRCAKSYISKFENDDSFEKRMQVALLKYLLFQVYYVDATRYISSTKLLSILKECADNEKISKNFLYRKVIASLRDSGVILASCTQGYKIKC